MKFLGLFAIKILNRLKHLNLRFLPNERLAAYQMENCVWF